MTDRAALRALAEAATPGPWHPADRGIGWEVHVEPHNDPDAKCWGQLPDGSWVPDDELMSGHKGTTSESDARYLAAVSPDVILALLDALDATR